MIVISEPAALNLFIQIGSEQILERLYGEVLVPESVFEEVLAIHPCLPGFVRVEAAQDQGEVQRLLQRTTRGKAEAIVLAKEQALPLLWVNEREGKEFVLSEGGKGVDLLGVMLQAKSLGLISSVRDMVEQLETLAVFCPTDEAKRQIFRAAGE